MPPPILDDRTRSGVWDSYFGGAERAGYAPRRNNFADPSDSPVSEVSPRHLSMNKHLLSVLMSELRCMIR